MGELQLDGLMREHEDPRADREPALELNDVPSRNAPNAAIGAASASGSLPRLAHTLRRGPKHVGVLPALPGSASQIHRPDMSTIAMPRLERAAARGIPRLFDRDQEDPTSVLEAPLVAALISRATPGAGRPRAVEPAPSASSAEASFDELAAELAESRVLEALRALPPGDVVRGAGGRPRGASRRPAIEPGSAGEPRRPLLRTGWQARLTLPVALLAVLGALSLLLRAIL